MKNQAKTNKAKNNGKSKLLTISEPDNGPSFRPCRFTLSLCLGMARKLEKFMADERDAAALTNALHLSIFRLVDGVELTGGDYRSFASDMRRAERAKLR